MVPDRVAQWFCRQSWRWVFEYLLESAPFGAFCSWEGPIGNQIGAIERQH